jgi:hypothetical protein
VLALVGLPPFIDLLAQLRSGASPTLVAANLREAGILISRPMVLTRTLPTPGEARKLRDFIEWASKYDTADKNMRSLPLHKKWMATLPCRCIRVEGDMIAEERLNHLLDCLRS